jgi:hypothetical protein
LEYGIGHLAAALFDHDAFDGTNVLTLGVIDIGAFYFVAADEASGFPRFCCHEIPPHFWPVNTVKHTHRTGMSWPTGHDFAVSDVPDTRLYRGREQKICQRLDMWFSVLAKALI